jgi:peptidoglycan/LPS O-acetylase OafA/YrhL
MTSKPAVQRLPSLAGLRGLLALVVLFGHMGYLSAFFGGNIQATLATIVHLGVGLVSGFFTLSGFILTWSHISNDRARAFWRRRFWKIVPNYVLAWAIATVFFVVVTSKPPILLPPEHDLFTSTTTLLFVQCWIPNLGVCTGVNPPAWSLSSEMFFYALFPLLIVLARKIPERRLGFVWTVVAGAILTMPLVAMTIPGPPAFSWLPMPAKAIWFAQAFPPVRLLEFFLGIVTARLVQTARWPRRSLPAGIALFVIAILAIPVLPPIFAQAAALAIPLCVIVAGLASKDIQHRPGFLSRPTMVRLGDASYALYILHFPILLIGRTIVGGNRTFSAGAGFLILFALMASAQALALIVHRYYEKPLAKRWSRPRAKDPSPNTRMPQEKQSVVKSAAPEQADPLQVTEPYSPPRMENPR